MSRLPLIHSISTVGVVKHYNQDYLIHDTRTDFTGSNGIGKSLLADMLQILFIAERKKIHFGTDSVKKEHRQIHTIPYKKANAYFFLNIEVESKMYVTFGVNIPTTSTGHIKLFRVLNDYFEPEKEARKTKQQRQKLDDYLIPESKLLYFNDFISNGTIPSIDKLVKHLRDEKKLNLEVFTKKAERNELYQFLFDKQILPLNLSKESNHTAFAKVLQAFSKAKTLDTDKDDSLKNFLFENKKIEIEKEYKLNKQNLDEHVDRYKNLNQMLLSLKSKREYLENLQVLLEKHEESEKEYFIYDFQNNKNELTKKIKEWDGLKNKFESLTKDVKNLKDTIPLLEEKKNKDAANYKLYSDALSALNTYKNKYDKYLDKEADLKNISDCKLPVILDVKTDNFKFESLTTKQILDNIDDLSEVLTVYKDFNGIEQQYQTQNKKMSSFLSNLESKKANLEKLLRILNLDDEKSFASKLLKQKQKISIGQETILRTFLLDVKWQLPTEILDGVMYTSDVNILDEKFIKEDAANRGFWYTMGAIKRFVAYQSEDPLFDESKALINAFSKKKETLLNEIKNLGTKINKVKKIERGDSESIKSLNLDFTWDHKIPDIRKVNQYEACIVMVQNIDSYKSDLQLELNIEKEKLDELSQSIPFEFSKDKLEEEIKKCSAKQSEYNKAQMSSLRELTGSETKLETKSKEFNEIVYDPEEIIRLRKGDEDNLNKQKKKILRKYPRLENDLESKIIDITKLDDIRKNSIRDKTAYELQYEQALENHKELLDDIEIRSQIKKETFEFKILEKKLLGNNIIETKNIERALNSLYKERNKLATTIIDTMLKIFHKTQNEFDVYKSVIARLNSFFKGELISKKYYFQLEFKQNDKFKISWINSLSSRTQLANVSDGLFASESVERFVEETFKEISGYTESIDFSHLLDPKTYFTLKTEFKDAEGKDYPGSTGESYTARVLLGIGRLSLASKQKREGLRFLILEEVSNLDDENFNTFLEIAKKHHYQIITMTPEPFGSSSDDGWYLHQLIEGKSNKDINYAIPNSSFKTNYQNEQLLGYLKRQVSE